LVVAGGVSLKDKLMQIVADKADRIVAATEAMLACDEYGPLHIVVSDSNVDDESIDWCEKNCTLNETERACVEALRELSESERMLAWELRRAK